MSGIIPPLVTPLKDNDTLDVEGLERLIEHLIAGGVHGLFILGTTGEEQSLSYHLRHEMIEAGKAYVVRFDPKRLADEMNAVYLKCFDDSASSGEERFVQTSSNIRKKIARYIPFL